MHMWEAMGAGCSSMTPDVLMFCSRTHCNPPAGVVRSDVPHESVGRLVPHCSVDQLVCGILSSSSWGTGMVLDDHHVLTCAHVVDGKLLCCVM